MPNSYISYLYSNRIVVHCRYLILGGTQYRANRENSKKLNEANNAAVAKKERLHGLVDEKTSRHKPGFKTRCQIKALFFRRS